MHVIDSIFCSLHVFDLDKNTCEFHYIYYSLNVRKFTITKFFDTHHKLKITGFRYSIVNRNWMHYGIKLWYKPHMIIFTGICNSLFSKILQWQPIFGFMCHENCDFLGVIKIRCELKNVCCLTTNHGNQVSKTLR